jgi:protein-tyrosine phosphatase
MDYMSINITFAAMKVLLVCLGNICRSPMAEGILRDKARERGLRLTIDSAGTNRYHTGEAPDHRAVAKMKEHGHDITDLRARTIEPEDFGRFDRILVMDTSNLQNVLRVPHKTSHGSKVSLFLNEFQPQGNQSVPDPYFGGDDGFEDVYQMLDKACEAYLNTLDGKS